MIKRKSANGRKMVDEPNPAIDPNTSDKKAVKKNIIFTTEVYQKN